MVGPYRLIHPPRPDILDQTYQRYPHDHAQECSSGRTSARQGRGPVITKMDSITQLENGHDLYGLCYRDRQRVGKPDLLIRFVRVS